MGLKTKLHEFIQTLLHEQEIIVVDFYSGETYARGKARRVAYFLEYNETRLKDGEIYLIENDIFKPNTICIHILKN